MKSRKSLFLTSFILVFAFAFAAQAFAASYNLPSYPAVQQEEDQWCWAGVSTSVLRFMAGKTISQCDFVNQVKSTTTCSNDSASTTEAQSGMHDYGVSSNYYSGYLNVVQVQNQIDDGRPVYVSWKWNSPTALTGHAVAIYGYNHTLDPYNWYMNYMDPWDGIKTTLEYENFNGGTGYDRTWRWGLKDFWHYE